MYTEAQKRAIYEWRKNHRKEYNEKQKEYGKKYYDKNSEKVIEHQKEYYQENKVEILKKLKYKRDIEKKEGKENV